MKTKPLILLLIFLMSIFCVSATYTITRNSPGQYSIRNDTTVDFNLTIVSTGTSENITCGIYNRSNRTADYALSTTYNATNNTATNDGLSLTFADSSRIWWYASCWDLTNELSTTNEVQSIPPNNTNINLTNDANGVSTVTGTVNYTQDNTDHVANVNVGESFTLSGNGTIITISSAIVNGTTASGINESTTLPTTNQTEIGLIRNGTIIEITSAYVNYSGNENWTLLTTGDYEQIGGTINVTNASILGNASLWNYNYYSWFDYVNYTFASGINDNNIFTLTAETNVLPATNQTEIGLVKNGSIVIVISAVVNDTGGAYRTMTAGDYEQLGATINVTNVSILGNTSLWTYNYSIISGVITAGTLYGDNNTLWNYTFMNNSLDLSGDFNITDGVVHMNSSTYAGDQSAWNYSYPLNSFVNQENTSIRIFDVDDYYSDFITIWAPIRLVPQAQGTCDATSIGTIYYDSTANKHYGCNSTAWEAMY